MWADPAECGVLMSLPWTTAQCKEVPMKHAVPRLSCCHGWDKFRETTWRIAGENGIVL